MIDGLQSEIENQIESSGDLSDANAELEEMRKNKEKLQDTKYKLNEQFSYHQVSPKDLVKLILSASRAKSCEEHHSESVFC